MTTHTYSVSLSSEGGQDMQIGLGRNFLFFIQITMPIIFYKYLSLIIVIISGVVYLIPYHLGFDASKTLNLFISMQMLLFFIITRDTDNIQELKKKIEELEDKIKDQESFITTHEEQLTAIENEIFSESETY